MSGDILQAALEYAKRGWPVVPLRGKVPWVTNWVEKASTDPATITGWWRTRGDSNVGLVTGPRSGFWVLDVDAGRDGLETLEALEAEHGAIATLRSRTGSGGLHLFFRLPEGTELGNRVDVLPGIDVRATGGQVVASPSVHPDTGRVYAWDDDSATVVSPAPAWLLALLAPPVTIARPYIPPTVVESSDRERRFVSQALVGACTDIAGAGEGQRHKVLHDKSVKLGGYIAAGLIAESIVVAELVRAGEASGKKASEVARTVRDGIVAGMQRPLRPALTESATAIPSRTEAMAWWEAHPEASSSEAAQVLGIKAATLREWSAQRPPPATPAKVIQLHPAPEQAELEDELVDEDEDDGGPLVRLAQVRDQVAAAAFKAAKSEPLFGLLEDRAWLDAMIAAQLVDSTAGVAMLGRLGDAFPGAKAIVTQIQGAIREGRKALLDAAKAGRGTMPPKPPERDEDGGDGPSGIPEIVISTDMEKVLLESIGALDARGEIYQRGAVLVHLTRDQSPGAWKAAGISAWDPDAPALRMVRPARLRVAMASSARWMKASKGPAGWEYESALPPVWAVEAAMARDEWPFKRAQGISEIPILRADGSLHEVPGHDPVSGYIYAPLPGFKLHPVTAPLTQELANYAYQRLCDPFIDFPFADPWHKAAAVSCLLSLIARPAIDGPVPMFPVLSTTPKSGKSMMVEIIHLLATGREIARMAPGQTEEEIEKRITTIAMAALPAILFDNLTGTFGGPSIDAAVQARVWQGRILGKSEPIAVPIRTVWTLTGNNLAIKGDLAQRVLPIQLAPDVERPELRTDFHIPNLRAYVRDPVNRTELLTAAFTLLRAHAIAGRPSTGTFGGYTEWNTVIRGALVWAGAPDPYQGVAQLAEVADERQGQMRALLETWFEAFSTQDVYLSDMQSHFVADRFPALFSVIKSIASTKDGHPDLARLPYILRMAAGRIYAGHRLDRSTTLRHGVRAWKVNRVGKASLVGSIVGAQEQIPY